MRSLFTLDKDSRVVIDPHALNLLPYKTIWTRDKSKSKEKAISELTYVYFMCDYKSFFSDIVDEEEKHKEICLAVFGEKDYNIDKAVKEAIEFYKKDIPMSVKVLEDAKIGINKLRQYFTDVDLTAEDDKTGKPKHDASKFSNVLKSLADNIENLDKLEDKVKRDTQTNNTVRGGREKGFFEDPE